MGMIYRICGHFFHINHSFCFVLLKVGNADRLRRIYVMEFLFEGFLAITWQQWVMYAVGLLLIYLAIARGFEPSLLLPMGFGAILVNLPYTGVLDQPLTGLGENAPGIIQWLFEVGIDASEALPILLFIGIGAMIDFGPLLSNPKMFLFGAAAQFGIFATILLAAAIGFDLNDAASIGIIGAADGPTSILVAKILKSQYMGAIAVAAYSYMALVPIVQPFAIKLVTTKKERLIRMDYNPKSVTKTTRILFPIIVSFIAGLVAPTSVALVGFLMFGNLIRECGVLNALSETAQNTLANLITLLLGITISFSMQAEHFVNKETVLIMCLGLIAFVFDTIGGVLFAKLLNLFLKKGKKINPMVGAAGISAFPMSARVVQKMGLKEDPSNHLLMHAISANVSGQIASVVAGGAIIKIVVEILSNMA
jgi:oxaloacetate decarboxylase beta subunit